jgi:ABC-type transporter Mla maintaining outer membrane lipid asymmetry ATPase subunit MlaF
MDDSDIIIRVEKLYAGYDDVAIQEDVNFDVRRGEVFGILGGSGCGKSTLLKHMIGLNDPISGHVYIDGDDIVTADGNSRAAILRRFGVMYQSGALFGSMTLLENVRLPLEEYTDLPDDAIDLIARMKLELVGLEGFTGHLPAELSGGMQKRVGLARAIAAQPDIIFFDEPTTGLDPIMGAVIDGIGSSTLTVEGVPALHPVEHRTVPDRIVAGTWAVAAAITRGDVFVRGAIGKHLEMALDKLASAGATVHIEDDGFRVRMDDRPRAVDIVTLPYPGFPTDLQPQFIAMNAVADGTAMITENLFEARFRFVNELARLGADVRTDGHHALVRGRPVLSGAPVEAADIRAGAGLVLAGLVAQGYTTVYDIQHIERGYAGFVPSLQGIGAAIERLDMPSPFDD